MDYYQVQCLILMTSQALQYLILNSNLSIDNTPSTIVKRDANSRIYCSTVIGDKIAPVSGTLAVPAIISANSLITSGITCNGKKNFEK
ncbi:hypothetical protein PAPYR_12125 [Paratrimastix pyriformis]|uniref:Uncharacterized protein n=1 Tax=Paratrimastix pyriformis TaxID=342808 RepID=A0ABQ8U635_9EUKA|nr:hypothetical protein PAPYR_12125 [Paratrimastix pyriformis]